MEMAFIDPYRHEPGSAVAGTPDGLRPLEWRELCARLAAARDFREAVAIEERLGESEPGNVGRPVASFHRPAALLLADAGHGGQIVNPMSSANGKGARGKRLLATAVTPAAPSEPSLSSRMR